MTNSAIAAKVKAVYGTFLKKEDYENLINRSSVSAAVAYLKSTPRYSSVFAETDEGAIHRGQVEQLLSEHVFKSYLRIKKFGAGRKNEILDFYIKKAEAEQIIKLIAAVDAKNPQGFFLSLPAYLMDYLSFDPAEAANAASLKDIAKLFESSKHYKPLSAALNEEKPNLNRCVTIVNGCYLKWAFTALNSGFKGRKRELLKQFFLKKTDMDNVLTCYRLKRFFDEDEETINELILPFHYRVKSEDIDSALKSQNPTDSLIKLMSEKCVSKKTTINEDFPELGLMKASYEYFRHRLCLTSDETEAVFAFLALADNERTNLQKIIEGIRYGENPAEIEKLVII